MSDSRQLAAILFSDISGFTSTMEHDETRAMSQIAKHREIITNVITDFNAYYLYWPLYLYYDKLNQSDKANGYLEMAYDIIGKEKIEKYNNHPEKDTHPEFFYCNDIISAYTDNIKQ